MVTKPRRIGQLLDGYIDRWLDIQVAQHPVKKRVGGRGGMVMVCGPCAVRKDAIAAGQRSDVR